MVEREFTYSDIFLRLMFETPIERTHFTIAQKLWTETAHKKIITMDNIAIRKNNYRLKKYGTTNPSRMLSAGKSRVISKSDYYNDLLLFFEISYNHTSLTIKSNSHYFKYYKLVIFDDEDHKIEDSVEYKRHYNRMQKMRNEIETIINNIDTRTHVSNIDLFMDKLLDSMESSVFSNDELDIYASLFNYANQTILFEISEKSDYHKKKTQLQITYMQLADYLEENPTKTTIDRFIITRFHKFLDNTTIKYNKIYELIMYEFDKALFCDNDITYMGEEAPSITLNDLDNTIKKIKNLQKK